MYDYEIGYGRPPKETRFKPGRSGNPHGRTKGSMNLETILTRALNVKVAVETPCDTKRITKREAIALQLVNRALAGDSKSMQALLPLIVKIDERNNKIAKMLEDVSKQDKEILKGFIDGKQTNNPATPTSSDSA